MRAIYIIGMVAVLCGFVVCDGDDEGVPSDGFPDFDSDLGLYQPQEDQATSGERLLNHILDEVDKGHVTRERISHWMALIKEALNRGELTQSQVDEFNATLRTKLAASSNLDTCCPFG